MDATLTLNDGKTIPRLGLGVYQATGGDEVTAVRHALDHGYRHIDTAAMYDNEAVSYTHLTLPTILLV